ncbi:hypothetical protein [Pontiella agarivorans]|uniref:PEP-CTERM sorting domain-containing protein n=1 Tax=Pontiella agarivorans TaxID=3038953 RepID=A0ABU5MUM8_9BACT|nr:hypothetical protein [Pontiella agarivorans]MDZ8117921.1 hypothetical protein [Pontiella agarivorans]
MKKIIATAAMAACAAVVTAQTVTSANIVGYTKVEAVGGELTLVALNFDAGSATLQDLLGTDLPALSGVFLWDKGTGAYVGSTLNTRGSWTPNLTVNTGDAFWVSTAGSGTNELILSGEVITDDVVVTLPAGIVATGYGYPVEKDFKDTQMASDLPSLSGIFLWDADTQSYAAWSKNTRGSWVGTGDPILAPSAGFWVDNAGSEVDVTEPVPFTP